MVRTTSVLCRIRYALRQRDAYKRKGVYKVNPPPQVAKQILEESGVLIVDPLTEIHPPPAEWVPPEEMLPDFRVPYTPQQRAVKDKPIWHLSSTIGFTEGIDQACLLTKSQRFNGLPPQIRELVDKYSLDDQDEKVKDVIRHTMTWNNTKTKLGKRIDLDNVGWHFNREYGIPETKSAAMILENFMRMSQSFCGRFPDLTRSRRVLFKPSIETSYNYHDETIEILAINEFMVTDKRPLALIGTDKMLEESVGHKLLDMYPVLPLVDLNQTDKYEEHGNKDTDRGAFKNVFDVLSSHPQIMFRINNSRRSVASNQAFNLMTTFGVAITEARCRYGAEKGKLEVPITVLNINASFDRLNFIVFQLNTMDYDNDDGIKNFAWFSSERFFKKVLNKPWLEADKQLKPPTYTNYNTNAFKNFLAMYLYDYDN